MKYVNNRIFDMTAYACGFFPEMRWNGAYNVLHGEKVFAIWREILKGNFNFEVSPKQYIIIIPKFYYE